MYTKIMPDKYKQHLLKAASMVLIMVSVMSIIAAYGSERIKIYYIRYDVKSSKNRIVDDNLLMIPAPDDFRAENFSWIFMAGVISAAPGEPKMSIEKKIRENALKTLLVDNGLKSINSKDHDTVISYEGILITPLTILKNVYNQKKNNYTYEIQAQFSPIAFPDKWETLNMKYKIKTLFHDFFQLFK